MKKRKKTSAVIVAVAMAGIPLAVPPALLAQRPAVERPLSNPKLVKVPAAVLKYADRYTKNPTQQTIVGIDNGMPIYQNPKGERFYLDPATGDMVFLSADAFAAFVEARPRPRPGVPAKPVKWSATKFGADVLILGVDAAGHVVHQNSRGEKFYLMPDTGDMVYVP